MIGLMLTLRSRPKFFRGLRATRYRTWIAVHGMPRALVTGGAGFIGRHLCQRLVSNGCEVTVIDDLSSGVRQSIPVESRFIEDTILNKLAIQCAVADVDVVFHLAAIASVEKCNQNLVSSHMTNVVGFLEIVDAIRALGRSVPIIYASSAAVYGNRAGTVSEHDAPDPISPYGADKLSMEMHARAAYSVHGQKSVGLRFFNVYGPGQNPQSPYSGVISIFMNRVINEGSVVIHGDGKQSRDFIYVSDVVDSLIAASRMTNMSSDIFNVATGRGTTILEILENLADITGKSPVYTWASSRVGDIRESIGNPELLRRQLGVEPRVDLTAGLVQLLSS